MSAGWKILDTQNNFFTIDLSEEEDLNGYNCEAKRSFIGLTF
jgi:hypothetical protein